MPKVPNPYEVNGKLMTGNGSLILICSLSNRSLLPSLTVLTFSKDNFFYDFNYYLFEYLIRLYNYLHPIVHHTVQLVE